MIYICTNEDHIIVLVFIKILLNWNVYKIL